MSNECILNFIYRLLNVYARVYEIQVYHMRIKKSRRESLSFYCVVNDSYIWWRLTKHLRQIKMLICRGGFSLNPDQVLDRPSLTISLIIECFWARTPI